MAMTPHCSFTAPSWNIAVSSALDAMFAQNTPHAIEILPHVDADGIASWEITGGGIWEATITLNGVCHYAIDVRFDEEAYIDAGLDEC